MTKTLFSGVGFLLLSFLFILSCTNNNRQDILKNSICDTTDTRFASVVYPIIVTNCNTATGCHGASPGSVSLEGYTNVKDNYTAILEQINMGVMPKGGSPLDPCLITKIQTWVNRGAQNN